MMHNKTLGLLTLSVALLLGEPVYAAGLTYWGSGVNSATYVEGTKSPIDNDFYWPGYDNNMKRIRYALEFNCNTTSGVYGAAFGIEESYIGAPNDSPRDCGDRQNAVRVCGSDNVLKRYYMEWVDHEGYHYETFEQLAGGEQANKFKLSAVSYNNGTWAPSIDPEESVNPPSYLKEVFLGNSVAYSVFCWLAGDGFMNTSNVRGANRTGADSFEDMYYANDSGGSYVPTPGSTDTMWQPSQATSNANGQYAFKDVANAPRTVYFKFHRP